VLASTWLCVPRQTASNEPPRRHQDLADALVSGAPKAAAEAMRRHIDIALKNTLQRLESYFRMREANRTTFARSVKKQAKLAQTEDRR
jgi:DNA-binding GntR family transcriptional regulator